MRCVVLAVVAGLAFLALGSHAQEPQEPVALDFDINDEVLSQMLGDLFEDDEFDENFREARAREDADETTAVEEKSVDPKDQQRYNSFIDTFLRRLNSYARSRFDPLSVGLTKKSSGKSAKKGNTKKSNKKSKKNNKKQGKKTKKSNKKKKSGRHPKSLDLEEVEEVAEAVEEEVEEEQHEIVKREVIDVVEIDDEEDEEDDEELEDEESLVRVTRDAGEEQEEEESVAEEVARRGKPAAGGKKGGAKKGGRKSGKKGKGKKGNKKGSKKGGKKGKKAGKKNAKKGGGKKQKRSAKGARTSRASVSGIASLQRDGDVVVKNHKGGKEMRAKFTLGPVDLKVNRRFGSGKDAVVKEARAVSPQLTGKLAIQVAQNGKAKLSNFRINRPAIVQVEGTLAKSEKGKSDNNFIENSIGRFTPIAAKKLKIASREILSAGEPKANSDA